jgi:hypothetical protein
MKKKNVLVFLSALIVSAMPVMLAGCGPDTGKIAAKIKSDFQEQIDTDSRYSGCGIVTEDVTIERTAKNTYKGTVSILADDNTYKISIKAHLQNSELSWELNEDGWAQLLTIPLKQEVQESMDSDARYSDYGMKVEQINLKNSGNGSYKGDVALFYDNTAHQVPINVNRKESSFSWEIDKKEFSFLPEFAPIDKTEYSEFVPNDTFFMRYLVVGQSKRGDLFETGKRILMKKVMFSMNHPEYGAMFLYRLEDFGLPLVIADPTRVLNLEMLSTKYDIYFRVIRSEGIDTYVKIDYVEPSNKDGKK